MKLVLKVFIKESLKEIKDLGKANFNGKMEKVMMENGKMELDMALEYGNLEKVTVTLEIGLMERLRDMEFILVLVVKNIKVSLKII